MQPFLLEKPVAHSTASKFSAVLIGRIDSRYIFNSVVCPLVRTVSPAKRLNRTGCLLGEGKTRVGSRNCALDGETGDTYGHQLANTIEPSKMTAMHAGVG